MSTTTSQPGALAQSDPGIQGPEAGAWSLPVETVAGALDSSTLQGLSETVARERLAAEGPNTLRQESGRIDEP